MSPARKKRSRPNALTKQVAPGGLRPLEPINVLRRGHRLEHRHGHLIQLTGGGEKVMDHGPIRRLPRRMSRDWAPIAGAASSGWLAYSWWPAPPGDPIALVETTWTVPTPPANGDVGQAVFIFPGLEDGNLILQPVLQYGKSQLGDDGGWAIASWYTTDTCIHRSSGLILVNPGDELVGIITGTVNPDASINYNCWFKRNGEDLASTNLPLASVPELTTCVQVLEAYNLSSQQSLPEGTIQMRNIQVQTASGNGVLSWGYDVSDSPYNVVVNVVNNGAPGGEVDFEVA
jgi:hypothetical protein